MHQIHFQLTDQLYDQAKRRALEAGFKSVDEFIADVVTDELAEDVQNLDHLFTPERLAHIETVVAKIRGGEKTHTSEEVREHLRKRFEA